MENAAYLQIMQQMIGGYQNEIAKVLETKDLTHYRYKAARDEERGRYDAHGDARLHLAAGILYSPSNTDSRLEDLIRSLLIEEIESRKNESREGIGQSLEILAGLLKDYNREEDKALFEAAKNANFDCYCGFEAGYPQYERDLETLDIDDCIYLAMDLGEKEVAAHLIKLWVDDQNGWNWENVNKLCRYETVRNNFIGELFAQKKRYELAKERSSWDWCSVGAEYMTVLLKYNNLLQARMVLEEMQAVLDNELFEWDTLGLGRSIMKSAVQLIVKKQDSEKIWQWLKPHLKENLMYLPLDLCEQGALAAKQAGDKEMAQILEQTYRETKAELESIAKR